MSIRDHLRSELSRRQARNPLYSLRAFARDLAIDHSTLSQILRGRRRLTPRSVRRLGPKLGLAARDVNEHAALADDTALLAFVSHSAFRPDSRWIAMRLGLPVDQVNIVLQRLLCRRILILSAQDKWTHREVTHG